MITNNLNKISGLKKEDLENIISILKKENKIESAYLFGSRAKGNYRNGSDVDIVLKGDQIDSGIISNISYLLNDETLMPYKFEVLNYGKINNSDLISHIDRNGQLIYSRM